MHKIIVALAASTSLTLAAAGCSGGGSAQPAGGGQKYIAIVSKGFQHQFWQAVKKGAEDEAAKQNVRISFDGPAAETDVEQQINMLQSAISKKPAAIGFAALDSKASANLLRQAQSSKIPVVAFDSGVDSDIPVTTVATNNKAAAAEGAKHLCEKVGSSGKVGLVVHDQTSKSGTDRRDGFLDGMKKDCPGVTVLAPQYGNDQAKAADITKSLITSNPDLKGIFGSNEAMGIGVVKGVQESGKSGLAVVGFDSGKTQIEAIKSGVEAGAVTQNPVGMGEQLVKAAVKAINNEQQPKTIDTGAYWYDKSNMDDPKIKSALYE